MQTKKVFETPTSVGKFEEAEFFADKIRPRENKGRNKLRDIAVCHLNDLSLSIS